MKDLNVHFTDNELQNLSDEEIDKIIEEQWTEQCANDEIKLELERKKG